MIETVQRFGSAARLVGVLTEASGPRSAGAEGRPTVILLNSGLIHRVGPNRLYVQMAREVARAGFDCLRFDFSGIGDSSVRTDSLPFVESGVAETSEAMDHLAAGRGASRFILAGLCSGGYFAFRAGCRDERVVGLALLNVRGHLGSEDKEEQDELEARAMRVHYRRVALSSSYRWKNVGKVLRGEFDVKGALRSLLPGSAPEERGDGRTDTSAYDALCARGVRVLHVYSEGDWSLDYLRVALDADPKARLSGPTSRFELVRGTNHVFSLGWSRRELVEHLIGWLRATEWGARPEKVAPPEATESVHDPS